MSADFKCFRYLVAVPDRIIRNQFELIVVLQITQIRWNERECERRILYRSDIIIIDEDVYFLQREMPQTVDGHGYLLMGVVDGFGIGREDIYIRLVCGSMNIIIERRLGCDDRISP